MIESLNSTIFMSVLLLLSPYWLVVVVTIIEMRCKK